MLKLHDYWRSSASYRVRIALALKHLPYERVTHDLRHDEQRSADYLALNPQGLVPMLEVDGLRIGQSLAIIEWLDARWPAPRLIPADPDARAVVMDRTLQIVADIHPLNNLRVLRDLRSRFAADQAAVDTWQQHWIATGFAALEAVAPDRGLFGGEAPDLVDLCLVPQVANARRVNMRLDAYPRLVAIDAAMRAIPEVAAAAPDRFQPAEVPA